jgi:integrase/recombinase XerC
MERLRALWGSYLATLSPHTRRAYDRDLADFARYLGTSDLLALIGNGPGEANALALGYKAALLERGLSPQTINRRLAALRAVVKLARRSGLITWRLEVDGERSRPYRDTRGPGKQGYQRLLQTLNGSNRPREIRDGAILHLLYDRALRRGEVARLDLADVDLEAGTVTITGKGRREPETLGLPPETVQALERWISTRGTEPGALFPNYDRAGKGSGRLTGDGIYKMVRARAKAAGIITRPHGLRHAAITEALELTGGNTAAVQDFSRHVKTETLRLYDDNRKSRGAEVARLVAAAAALGASPG